jgi:anti-sigma factor RsiW
VNRDEHRAVRESLGAYVLGGLDGPEQAAVQAHLDGCPACRAELREIEPVVEPLRSVDPDRIDRTPVPPPWLGQQIVDRAMADRPTRRRSLLTVAAAVAVVAALAGGLGFMAGQGTVPNVPRELVAVEAFDPRVDVSATVVPHTWGVEITLDANGFAPGAVYRVVVLDDAGREVNAGEFIGTGDTRMLCNLNSSVLRADAAGFDVLDATGDVVLHGEL